METQAISPREASIQKALAKLAKKTITPYTYRNPSGKYGLMALAKFRA